MLERERNRRRHGEHNGGGIGVADLLAMRGGLGHPRNIGMRLVFVKGCLVWLLLVSAFLGQIGTRVKNLEKRSEAGDK